MPTRRQRHAPAARRFPFPPRAINAVVFDLDGVVTETAALHMAAWKDVFDDLLARRAEETTTPFSPFTAEDYGRYVDGRPRLEGADAFLRSRGIELPLGSEEDEPGTETVAGIGNLKNERYLHLLRRTGAKAFGSSVALIRALREAGIPTAAITASRNGREVMRSAGVAGLFDVTIDGIDAAAAGLAGKPAPDVFLEAARLLGVPPERAAIVEDSESGVIAGQAGGFGFVLGVDRLGRAEELRRAGADEVVADLGELRPPRMLGDVPSALEARKDVAERLTRGRLVVFLDYDGTLAPIVADPDAAEMPASVRAAVTRLARAAPVTILSGRDLRDVRRRARLDGVYYAGSHGFEIVGPDGEPIAEEHAREFERFLPALDAAEQRLRRDLAGLEGVVVERKRFAIAVHYRRAPASAVPPAGEAVDAAARGVAGLRRTGGKRIFELRPDVDWDKGRALLRLLELPGLGGPDAAVLFIGDDETDEDALRVVAGRGVGLAVRGEADRPTFAEYALDDPEAAGDLLGYLADRLGGREDDR